jgi:hypothetical protein
VELVLVANLIRVKDLLESDGPLDLSILMISLVNQFRPD